MEIFMSAKDTMENKITEGVIWKQLLLFFFPILVGTFFQQLYNTVDAVIVGRFVGKEALSCVSGSSDHQSGGRIFYRIICRRNSYDLPAFWGKK